jgi:Flp pilus assembly protein TadD
MNARRMAFVIAAAVVVYLGLVVVRGIAFITSGDPVAQMLGVAVLVLPLLGLGLAGRELAFGRATQRLGQLMEASGTLPVDDLPRRPSGRVVREAADARAQLRISEVDQAPKDWQAWFRLAIAYDDAGDRRRARAAMRQAIVLHKAANSHAG